MFLFMGWGGFGGRVCLFVWGVFLFVFWKVVRSDTDCEGASESDTPTVQTAAKKTKSTPSSAVSVEEQCSDRDEQNNKYQNISGSTNTLVTANNYN